MSRNICTDFASLYPTMINPVKRSFASTIGKDLVAVKPMAPPSGIMPYMDFHFVSPWVFDYEKIPGAIHVKIKDTFNNILDFLETPNIIVAKVIDFKIDTKFVGNSIFAFGRQYYNNLGITGNKLEELLGQITVGHGDFPGDRGDPGDEYVSGLHHRKSALPFTRDTLVEIEIILYAPQTPFVKRNAICNHAKEYWKEDMLVDYTCKGLINSIFRKRRGHNN